MSLLALTGMALNFTVPLSAADSFSLEQFVSYTNEEKGYSIEYPADWLRQENTEPFDILVQAPNNGASMSVISGEVSGEINTDLYYTLNLKNLLNDNASIQIKDNCKTDLNGIKAYWLRYTRVDQTVVDITQHLFVNNETGFVITTGTATSDYPVYKDILNKIVKSFQRIEPKPEK